MFLRLYLTFPDLLRAENIPHTSFVREIFDILFRNPPKSPRVSDFVGYWIRQPRPVISVIYPEEYKSRSTEFTFYKSDFDAYNFKRDKWFNPIGQYTFTPSIQTLSAIDEIHRKFHFPSFPTVNENLPVPHRRARCEEPIELPLPRRTRRKPVIAEEPQDGEQDEHRLDEEPLDEERQDGELDREQENANCSNCLQHVEQPACIQPPEQLFTVGMSVNAVGPTEPYLAGYVTKIEGEDIFVKFPYGRCNDYEYKYNKSKVQPFQTQFPNGRFTPLKVVSSRPIKSQMRKIKTYEERLQHFLNTQE